MIGGNLLQQLYNVTDTLIVGKTLGAAALAAVGSSYSLMVLLTSIILGLCMGSGVVFAHFYGAGDEEALKTAIGNACVFTGLMSVLINILSMAFLDRIIALIRIPPEVSPYARDYLRVILYGMSMVSVYNFFAAILRSIGNTVIPLVFLAISAVANIVLDLVFILVLKRGVKGAAEATVLAQGLSALCIMLYFLTVQKRIRPGLRHLVPRRASLSLIISNSTLSAVQQSIMNFGILMVQGLVNSFGFAASAAFAIVVKIDSFAYMPAQDFGNAFATFVAQNAGAGRYDRVKAGLKSAVRLSTCFCILSSAIVWLCARPLALIFVNKSEEAIIAICVEYLHIEGLFYCGIGILFILYALYRGLGKPQLSIVLTIISLGIRVALAYSLSAIPGLGMTGIWWSVPIGWALADAAGFLYYRARIKSL